MYTEKNQLAQGRFRSQINEISVLKLCTKKIKNKKTVRMDDIAKHFH